MHGLPGDTHPALREFPSKLFVEVTTRCNLNCVMCVKQNVRSACDGDLTRTLFGRLQPAMPHLDALVLNGIGEPLLHPDLEHFIRSARKEMTSGWIGFQSNGLLLTNLRAVSLVEAGIDRICLSIDGASAETFRRVREGGDLEDVGHAFAALAAAKERCGRPEVRVGVEYVVMRSNMHELPAALRWAAEQGAAFAIVTHALPYSPQHRSETVYSTCTAEAIALFDKYKEEAAGEGLDIHGYFDARWKYSRNAMEQRLVSLVAAMRAEAARQGIFIDMKKLLQRDADQSERIAAVLEEAREVADRYGIELRLPALTLSNERHCGFVEEGGAFVSWEGKVSPCYFLWHRYRCFAGGWKQEVHPKVFGSLADRSILEIWNDRQFRSFREQVIRYGYPDCNSCSLAPCDYVGSDTFEQDCHIMDIPCGACLWCMGVFQCMS